MAYNSNRTLSQIIANIKRNTSLHNRSVIISEGNHNIFDSHVALTNHVTEHQTSQLPGSRRDLGHTVILQLYLCVLHFLGAIWPSPTVTLGRDGCEGPLGSSVGGDVPCLGATARLRSSIARLLASI